jgi:hypothetical protein
MDVNDSFKWPELPYPPPPWWQLRGAEFGLDEGQIRFAAALVTLGGPDARQNSLAASLAGMDLSRTEAFRLARSVKVRRLVNEAEETKTGNRDPLSEQQIDDRIDAMIRSPNDLAASKGIELRDRRAATRHERELAERQREPEDILKEIARHSPFRALQIRAEKELPAPDDAAEILRGHYCQCCAQHVARALGIDLDLWSSPLSSAPSAIEKKHLRLQVPSRSFAELVDQDQIVEDWHSYKLGAGSPPAREPDRDGAVASKRSEGTSNPQSLTT